MFDRVFVPLEGSSDSESVLTWLRSWDLADSKLTLFHCIPPQLSKEEVQESSRFETADQAREYLEAVGRTVTSPTEVLVRTGSPGERIVTAALQADAGLVVLGVSGDYGSPRTLGKAAGTVIKTCPQPVLVVKTPVRPSRRRVRRILAPLDASSRGDENMDVLRDVARDLRAEIILLHVGSPDSENGLGDGRAASSGSSYSDVQLNLIRQVWGFLKDGIAARTIMTKGSIVEEILTHEQSLDVDMVAIPKESRPGMLSWTPLVDKCERAVLLYEPREAASEFTPKPGRTAAVRI
jgi:nucleotide-binding universal stress UspA family protein